MKIAQVIPNLRMGGAEIMCENLTKALIEHGEKVFIVSLYDDKTIVSKRLETQGVKIYYLNKKLGFDYNIILRLVRVLKNEKPDAIHAHLYAASYAMIAAIITGCKSRVLTIHTLAHKDNIKIGRVFNKILFSLFHVTPVALSKQIQDTIIRQYKLKRKYIPIVHNGIDISKCVIKTSYSLNNTYTILHVGRFSPVKNHIALIKAFNMVIKKINSAKLLLVGDGELYSECKSLVSALGLTDSVKFYGQLSNVYPLYESSDVFILPSLFEGMPMSIIEAMGSGLPIIASDVGGISDMIVSGVSGLLIKPTEQGIYDALIAMYLSENFRSKLGQNALKASRKYSSSEMANRYLEIYVQKF